MFQGTTQETHYTRLYSCKHFRNRVIRLQTLCAKLNLDAIVLIIGKYLSYLSSNFAMINVLTCRYRHLSRPRDEKALKLAALWSLCL